MLVLTLTLLAVAWGIIYFYVKYLYSYWQRRGIPYLKPSFPFGNFSKTFIQKLSLGEQFAELYRSTTEPLVGIFMLHSPFLLIRDPKLIRCILITDFQYFTDRVFYFNEKEEPLTAHLGALSGQRWRDMRAKLVRAYTPHKMKMIFPKLLDCGNQLQAHLSKVVSVNHSIEMCEMTACCALNIVASTAFGIDVDCLADPNHPFRNAERKTFENNLKNGLRFFGWFFQPTLLKWSGLRFVDPAVEEYFLNLVAKTLEMRQKKNIVRKDFLQFLIEIGNSDVITPMDNDERKTVTEKSGSKESLSFEQIAAQAFIFFSSGIQSISIATSYCLYEIAKCPDIQQKIHEEIDHIMTQHSSQLTYESINELKYLDCCLYETFRKYQFLHLSRVCVKDYRIPGTNVTIEKGTSIIVPTIGLHLDEKFYPNPEKFDPTRFYDENKADKNLTNMPYLPFGDGPRNCIGKKMAKMFVKVVICSLLQQYYFDLDDRHIGNEIKMSSNMHPIGGIHLKLKAKQFKN